MGAPDNWSARLEDIEKRIKTVREAQKPQRRKTRGDLTTAHVAWRMTLEMVVGGLIGAAMGWGLDALFGTRPGFLIVFVLLGTAAGIRTAMRSAEELRREQIEGEAEEAARAAAEKEEDRGAGGG